MIELISIDWITLIVMGILGRLLDAAIDETIGKAAMKREFKKIRKEFSGCLTEEQLDEILKDGYDSEDEAISAYFKKCRKQSSANELSHRKSLCDAGACSTCKFYCVGIGVKFCRYYKSEPEICDPDGTTCDNYRQRSFEAWE